jgi:hypothetical protein
VCVYVCTYDAHINTCIITHTHIYVYTHPHNAPADYVNFLKRVTPNNQKEYLLQLQKFNFNQVDCPVFDGMYQYNQVCVRERVCVCV